MSIDSKASENAKNSPFYLYNKEVCDVWEEYVTDKIGEVDGGYSEWAININGSISSLDFTFSVKKSTITSGNLLIPSNKNIRNETILLFNKCSAFNEKFIIRKKSLLDKIGVSGYQSLNKKYSIQKQNPLEELSPIIKILKLYFESESVKEMFYNKTTKQIQITFDQLIEEQKIVEEIFEVINNKKY